MSKVLIKTENLSAVLPKEYLRQSIADMYEHGLPRGLNTGLDSLDNLFRLDTGRLCVITGVPNDGKSEFVDFLTTSYNRQYGMKTLYFSPENQPVAFHLAKLVSKFTCKRFSKNKLSPEELNEAIDYIGDNFFFFNYSKVKTSSQILSLAKEQIKKTGAGILVIDAFNKIESESPNEDNLLYISRLLDELCTFAIGEDVLIILVAHPRKMDTDRQRIPTPYDINGSANFFNKSDFVISIQRNRDNEDNNTTEVVVGKVKFSNYGKQGRITLNYDEVSGNYYPCEDTFTFNDGDAETSSQLPEPFHFPKVVSREPLDVEVSVYSGIGDKVGKVVSLKEFLLTDAYKDIAEDIRKGKTPEERKERKKNHLASLPCATISGTFSQREAKSLESLSGLISIDIDYADNKEIMKKVPAILRKLDYVSYFAKSITGDGYFAICKVAEPTKLREHFAALEKEFKELGITLDKSCKDVSRLRFATYDECAYYNPHASTYLSVIERALPKSSPSVSFEYSNGGKDEQLVQSLIQQLHDKHVSIPDDYDTWFKVGMSLSSTFGEKGREYFHSVSSLSPKYDKYECDEQYDEILSHYAEDNEYTLGTFVHYVKETLNQ